jgi:hypothetical protein
VSQVVGGARAVAQIAAGLTGLDRLGITPLPLLSSHYPDRLRALPQPPLVLYVQGTWPIAQPVCLLESSGELEPAIADAWAALHAAVSQHVAWAAAYESSRESPRLLGVPWGLMRVRQRLTHEQWGAVSSGATTLLSTVAPTTHGDAASAEAAAAVLVAMAGTTHDDRSSSRSPDVHGCAAARIAAAGREAFVGGIRRPALAAHAWHS